MFANWLASGCIYTGVGVLLAPFSLFAVFLTDEPQPSAACEAAVLAMAYSAMVWPFTFLIGGIGQLVLHNCDAGKRPLCLERLPLYPPLIFCAAVLALRWVLNPPDPPPRDVVYVIPDHGPADEQERWSSLALPCSPAP